MRRVRGTKIMRLGLRKGSNEMRPSACALVVSGGSRKRPRHMGFQNGAFLADRRFERGLEETRLNASLLAHCSSLTDFLADF